MKQKKPANKLTKPQLLRRFYKESSARKKLLEAMDYLPSWDEVSETERRAKKIAEAAIDTISSRLEYMHAEISRAELKMRSLAADNFIMRKKLKKAGIPHA